ncbi:MAG: dihydroorotase [Firmicutes bacterium]|nr:dihydroorotase [Bacillota bacterium]
MDLHCEEPNSCGGSVSVSEFHNCFLLPGLVDVHVHLREPGFFYKETIATGTAAAARGGYSDVCAMPNLNPVPDCPAHLAPQLEAIERSARVRVHPYGALTVGEQGEALADLSGLSPQVAAFSDDGRGVQSESMMRQAMLEAKRLGKLIAAHCEDNRLLRGGYIHDGEYARLHGHRGICSESEWGPVARDLRLVKETGCRYHVCHVSAKETVALIRQAKKEGLDVTCETGPHYLLKNDMDLQEDGRFKMNPPIRSEADRQALLEGILDGTIDMIATDHAPHSAEEKGRGLQKSLMGVVGLETALPVLYTGLVKPGILSLEKLVALMSTNPRARFGLPQGEDYSLWDLNTSYEVNPAEFLTMGRATPFGGETVFGRCKATIVGGKLVWLEK